MFLYQVLPFFLHLRPSARACENTAFSVLKNKAWLLSVREKRSVHFSTTEKVCERGMSRQVLFETRNVG